MPISFRSSLDLPLEQTGFEPSVPPRGDGLSCRADRDRLSRRGAPEAQRPARLLLAAIVAIARAAGFRMLVMSRIRHAAIRLGGCGPGSPDGCGCEQPCGLQAAWLAGPSRPKRAAKYPEYRCRTTIAVPIGENASETGSLSGIR